MSDFIYPKCPSCGVKASRGGGVGLYDVTTGPFTWTCNDCGDVHTGVFHPDWHEVDWLNSRRPTAFERVKQAIPFL